MEEMFKVRNDYSKVTGSKKNTTQGGYCAIRAEERLAWKRRAQNSPEKRTGICLLEWRTRSYRGITRRRSCEPLTAAAAKTWNHLPFKKSICLCSNPNTRQANLQECWIQSERLSLKLYILLFCNYRSLRLCAPFLVQIQHFETRCSEPWPIRTARLSEHRLPPVSSAMMDSAVTRIITITACVHNLLY